MHGKVKLYWDIRIGTFVLGHLCWDICVGTFAVIHKKRVESNIFCEMAERVCMGHM